MGGGDLLGGFSFDTQPKTAPQVPQNRGIDSLLGDDFLGGGSSQPKQSVQPIQPVQNQSLGFDFLGTGSAPVTTTPPVSNNNNMAIDFLGQPVQQQKQDSSNSFKFKAYETQHLEIWMDCKKEGDGNTKIVASFMNKTHSYIDQLNLQTAVMKYLKIAIQPMSGTNLPPNSKGAVTQHMTVTNSAVGQKPIVMKVKLSYAVNGEKLAFEEKIEGFPNGF